MRYVVRYPRLTLLVQLDPSIIVSVIIRNLLEHSFDRVVREQESSWHVKISVVIELCGVRADCRLPSSQHEPEARPTNLFAGTSDFEGLVTTKPPIRLIPN